MYGKKLIVDTDYDAITPEELKSRQEKGILYDVVIDCSGYGPAIENAINLLNFGGKLCIFGVAPPDVKIRWCFFIALVL